MEVLVSADHVKRTSPRSKMIVLQRPVCGCSERRERGDVVACFDAKASRSCVEDVGEDVPLETLEKSSDGKERGEDVTEVDIVARVNSSIR